MEKGGQLSQWLDSGLLAARALWQRLADSEHYRPLLPPELDIVVYAVNANDALEASSRARRVFELAAKKGLHLAMIELPVDLVRTYLPELDASSDTVTCLRSVLMKPEHFEWLEQIEKILNECGREVTSAARGSG